MRIDQDEANATREMKLLMVAEARSVVEKIKSWILKLLSLRCLMSLLHFSAA